MAAWSARSIKGSSDPRHRGGEVCPATQPIRVYAVRMHGDEVQADLP